MSEPIEPQPLLTTDQIADRYGMTTAQVWKAIRIGVKFRIKLRAVKVGGHWKTTIKDAEDFLRRLNDVQQ